MSVSWARDERLRRACCVGGGLDSRTSLGGDTELICAAESRRPPSRCRRVWSSTWPRTRSSHPLPPCQTRPTWWLKMGRLQTKHIAAIVLRTYTPHKTVLHTGCALCKRDNEHIHVHFVVQNCSTIALPLSTMQLCSDECITVVIPWYIRVSTLSKFQ